MGAYRVIIREAAGEIEIDDCMEHRKAKIKAVGTATICAIKNLDGVWPPFRW